MIDAIRYAWECLNNTPFPEHLLGNSTGLQGWSSKSP